MSADLINEVRNEIAADRAARYAAQAVARAQANADFLAKQAAEKAAQEAAEIAALEAEDFLAKWKKAGKIGLVVGGVIIVGYGIYKAIPKVKARWAEHRHHENEESEAA